MEVSETSLIFDFFDWLEAVFSEMGEVGEVCDVGAMMSFSVIGSSGASTNSDETWSGSPVGAESACWEFVSAIASISIPSAAGEDMAK